MAGFSSRRLCRQCLWTTTAVFLSCLNVVAQTALPYERDFESPDFTPGIVQSDPDWAFDPLSLSVEITDAEAASAAQSLTLQGSSPLRLRC